MNKLSLIIFFLFISFSFNILNAQTSNHPTVDKLEVSYRETDIATVDTFKMVTFQSVITLKIGVDVSAIHYKIINESNNTIVYQVDYSFNSPIITNPEGIVLFRKDANVLYIMSANEISMNTYLYQITTEDSQGIVSETYSDFK